MQQPHLPRSPARLNAELGYSSESTIGSMPEVSRFFGISIRLYYNVRDPPHFHAIYGECEALLEIDTLSVLRGQLPRRALALVLEWAALHRSELRMDWIKARMGELPLPIDPLD
jgi:hypothetical protein